MNPLNNKICALGALYVGDKPSYLRECLISLNQQTISIPIYMVIDGPITDELEKELTFFEDLNIKFLRSKENKGLAQALQNGLELIAKNFDYVIRFDSDDINHSNRFEIISNYFYYNEVDLVSSHMREINEIGVVYSKRKVPVSYEKICLKIPYRNPINHPASAFKVSAVLMSGGYIEMPFFEDWYLWCRMLKNGFRVENIDKYLVDFRATDAMISRRYGLNYFKHEFKFFLQRHNEDLTNPIQNMIAYLMRFLVKLFGFQIYKKVFFFVRR